MKWRTNERLAVVLADDRGVVPRRLVVGVESVATMKPGKPVSKFSRSDQSNHDAALLRAFKKMLATATLTFEVNDKTVFIDGTVYFNDAGLDEKEVAALRAETNFWTDEVEGE